MICDKCGKDTEKLIKFYYEYKERILYVEDRFGYICEECIEEYRKGTLGLNNINLRAFEIEFKKEVENAYKLERKKESGR